MLKEKFKLALYNLMSEKRVVKKICNNISNNVQEFKTLPLKYRANKEITTSALLKDGSNLQYTSDELRDDPEIVRIALNTGVENFKWTSDRLKSDKQFANLCLIRGYNIFKYLSDELKSDSDLAIKAVTKEHNAFKYVDKRLRESQEFLLLLIKELSANISVVPNNLLNDKDFILTAVSVNSGCIHHVPTHLKQDEDVMLLVLQMDPSYYKNEYIIEKFNTIQFAIKAMFANPDVFPRLSVTKSEHPQIQWLKNNIDNINPEHKRYIKDTFLKYPNAFLYPDDIVKALMLGTPEDYLIMAHYAIAKNDKTKNTQPDVDADFKFIPD